MLHVCISAIQHIPEVRTVHPQSTCVSKYHSSPRTHAESSTFLCYTHQFCCWHAVKVCAMIHAHQKLWSVNFSWKVPHIQVVLLPTARRVMTSHCTHIGKPTPNTLSPSPRLPMQCEVGAYGHARLTSRRWRSLPLKCPASDSFYAMCNAHKFPLCNDYLIALSLQCIMVSDYNSPIVPTFASPFQFKLLTLQELQQQQHFWTDNRKESFSILWPFTLEGQPAVGCGLTVGAVFNCGTHSLTTVRRGMHM